MNFPKSFSELYDKYFPEEYQKERAKMSKEEIEALNNLNVREASEFVPIDLNSVVADTLEWTSEEPNDFDDVTQTSNGVYSFSLNCDNDLSVLRDFLMGEPTDEQTREVSVVIHGANSKTEIYKPRNLKYPNKKRAKRIKRKWFNRYDANFGQPIIIPKCQINFDADGYHLTALEAPRPKNTRKLIFGF